MSRPSNWYDMSQDERRRWEQAEAQRQDTEFAAEEAQRRAETAERNLQRRRCEQAAEREDYEQRLEAERAEANELAEELAEVEDQRDELLKACEAALVKFNSTPLDKVSVAADMLRAAIAKVKGNQS